MLRAVLAAYGAVCFALSSMVGLSIPAAYQRAAMLPPAAASVGLLMLAFAVVVGWIVGALFIACAVTAKRPRKGVRR